MHLTFTSSSSSVSNLIIGRPDNATRNDTFDCFTSSVADNWGSCKTEQICFDEICVCLANYNINSACVINLKCRQYTWLMNFVLIGECLVKLPDSDKQLLSAGNYYSFRCSPAEKIVEIDVSSQVLTICLTDAFMHKLIEVDAIDSLMDDTGILKMIATGNFLNSRTQPILADIMDESKPGYIRRILIEAKILELLSMQLHKPERHKPEAFSKEDVKRLHDAREQIAANLRTPCSLVDLARRTGLNDFKLKKGFKALFGQTVFGYLSDLRMEAAYNYLQDGKTVSEVAELIGYKNPHHFTAAFKKKFGFLPSQVARMASAGID